MEVCWEFVFGRVDRVRSVGLGIRHPALLGHRRDQFFIDATRVFTKTLKLPDELLVHDGDETAPQEGLDLTFLALCQFVMGGCHCAVSFDNEW